MRLYNGCPDSDLKRLWAKQDAIMEQVRKLEPKAYCTRFNAPDEGYMVHVWGKPITWILPTKIEALQQALKTLEEKSDESQDND